MSEPQSEMARLLEGARHAHGPTSADRERVLARLHATLGMAPIAPMSLPPQQPVAPAPSPPSTSPPPMPALPTGHEGLALGKGAGAVGTLLKWKAGKLLLASLALSGVVSGATVMLPARDDRTPSALDRPRAAQQTSEDAGAHVDEPQADVPAPRPRLGGRSTRERRARHEPDAREERAMTARSARRSRASDDVREVSPSIDEEAEALWAEADDAVDAARRAEAARSASARREAAALAERAAPTEKADVEEPAQAEAREEPAAAPPRKPQPPDPATAELALMRRALTSLRDNQAKQALVLLNEHEAEYPRGAFATERRGLRVVALCAAGHLEQGLQERAAFLRQAGSSPIAERVRRACQEGKR